MIGSSFNNHLNNRRTCRWHPMETSHKTNRTYLNPHQRDEIHDAHV